MGIFSDKIIQRGRGGILRGDPILGRGRVDSGIKFIHASYWDGNYRRIDNSTGETDLIISGSDISTNTDIRTLATSEEGDIYGTSRSGNYLAKYSGQNGALIWETEASGSTHIPIINVAADGNIHTVTSGTLSTNTQFRRFSPDGTELGNIVTSSKTKQTGGLDQSSNLYFNNVGNQVVKVDATGSSFEEQAQSDVRCVTAAPSGFVYLGFDSGAVQKRRYSDWSIEWTVAANTPFTSNIWGVETDGDFVYAVSLDKKSAKIDAATGAIIWTYTMPEMSVSIDVSPGGFVYIGDDLGNLDKVDSGGNQVWRNSDSTERVSGISAFHVAYGANPSEW